MKQTETKGRRGRIGEQEKRRVRQGRRQERGEQRQGGQERQGEKQEKQTTA